jgi:hypothetical protein
VILSDPSPEAEIAVVLSGDRVAERPVEIGRLTPHLVDQRRHQALALLGQLAQLSPGQLVLGLPERCAEVDELVDLVSRRPDVRPGRRRGLAQLGDVGGQALVTVRPRGLRQLGPPRHERVEAAAVELVGGLLEVHVASARSSTWFPAPYETLGRGQHPAGTGGGVRSVSLSAASRAAARSTPSGRRLVAVRATLANRLCAT